MVYKKIKSQAAMDQPFLLENSPTDTYHLCLEGCRDDTLVGELESSRSILENLDAAEIYLPRVHMDNWSFSNTH